MKALLLALLAQARGGVVVERIAGSEPPRLAIRCDAATTRTVLLAICNEAGVDSRAVADAPRDVVPLLDRTIGPIALRTVTVGDAIDRTLGAAGLLGRIERGALVVEAFPDPKAPESRARIRAEAIDQFQAFLALAPDHAEAPRASLELAALHEEDGSIERAVAVLEALEESRPDRTEAVRARVERGRLELARNRAEAALVPLLEVLDRHANDPAAAEAYTLVGRCRLALGTPGVAEKYLALGAERFAASTASYSSRIWRVEALRRAGDASAAWREIARLESTDLRAEDALELLEVRTRAEEAAGLLDEAAHGWLALALHAQGSSRDEKFARAAATAFAAGDAMGALLARAASKPDAAGAQLVAWALDAGFPQLASSTGLLGPAERLLAARIALAEGDVKRAAAHLDAIPT
ncbi:MAG TPA: tetratricopeptide repeat protein, partial [Planctomycetota bacterium]|nr:tetratricopeptide repeat protein [Planctomycetota bacterium]